MARTEQYVFPVNEYKIVWGQTIDEKRSSSGMTRYFSSFRLKGVMYKLYDTVYLNPEGGSSPYIGRITELCEIATSKDGRFSKENSMTVRWFCRPCEMPPNLNVHYSESRKEVFLMYGYQSSHRVDPASTLKRCKVVCLADEEWNVNKPSVEEMAAADHFFDQAVSGSRKKPLPLRYVLVKCDVHHVIGAAGDGRSTAGSNGHIKEADRPQSLDPISRHSKLSALVTGLPTGSPPRPLSVKMTSFEHQPGRRDSEFELSSRKTNVRNHEKRALLDSSSADRKSAKSGSHLVCDSSESLRGPLDNREHFADTGGGDAYDEEHPRRQMVDGESRMAKSAKKRYALHSDHGADEGRVKKLKSGCPAPLVANRSQRDHERDRTGRATDFKMRRQLKPRPGNEDWQQQNHSQCGERAERDLSSSLSPSPRLVSENADPRGVPPTHRNLLEGKRLRPEPSTSPPAIVSPNETQALKRLRVSIDDLEGCNPAELRECESKRNAVRLYRCPAVSNHENVAKSDEQFHASGIRDVRGGEAQQKAKFDRSRCTDLSVSKPLIPSKQPGSSLCANEHGKNLVRPKKRKLPPQLLELTTNNRNVASGEKPSTFSTPHQRGSPLGSSTAEREAWKCASKPGSSPSGREAGKSVSKPGLSPSEREAGKSVSKHGLYPSERETGKSVSKPGLSPSEREAGKSVSKPGLSPSHGEAGRAVSKPGVSPSEGEARRSVQKPGVSLSEGEARRAVSKPGSSPSEGEARKSVQKPGVSPSEGEARRAVSKPGLSLSEREARRSVPKPGVSPSEGEARRAVSKPGSSPSQSEGRRSVPKPGVSASKGEERRSVPKPAGLSQSKTEARRSLSRPALSPSENEATRSAPRPVLSPSGSETKGLESRLGLSSSDGETKRSISKPSTSRIDSADTGLASPDLLRASGTPRDGIPLLSVPPNARIRELAEFKEKIYKPKEKFMNHWNQKIQSSLTERKAVIFHNLDPWFSSCEVEAILRVKHEVDCEARMLQPLNSGTYTTGRALVMFYNTEDASKTLQHFRNNWVIWTEEVRPVVARWADEGTGKTSHVLGFLDIRKLIASSDEKKEQESETIAHLAQPNTVEYEMGLHWRLLQRRAQRTWEAFEEDYANKNQEVDTKDGTRQSQSKHAM